MITKVPYKAVVTGASGHIGANIIRELLQKGFQVRVLVHKTTKALEGLDVEVFYGNLSNLESLIQAFSGMDYVFNTAGYVSIQRNDWDSAKKINVLGLVNIVKACIIADVKRLIHFSSIEALDRNSSLVPVDENFPLVTQLDPSPYAFSKAIGEKFLREVCSLGFDAVILNPTSVIGPFDFKLGKSSQALFDIYKGRLPILVQGKADWVDSRDVACAAVNAALMATAGSRYILSGHQIEIKQLAEKINSFSGRKNIRVYLPLWIVRLFIPLATLYFYFMGKEPLITDISISAMEGNWTISHQKADNEILYKVRSFNETIEDCVKWFEKIKY